MPRFIAIFLTLFGLTSIWEMEGASLDPNGQTRTDEGGSLDPSGRV